MKRAGRLALHMARAACTVRSLLGASLASVGLAIGVASADSKIDLEVNKTQPEELTRSLLPDLPDAGGLADVPDVPVEGFALGTVEQHLPERGLRIPDQWTKFPMWLHDRRLVAKFQRLYHGVHIFTVGVYVNKRCDIWGQAWQLRNPQELLERAVGNTTLRYEIVSKYLTRKMWAQDLMSKEISEHFHGPRGEKAAISRMHERLTYRGPIFHTGAVLDFVLQDNGVWYLFNEQYIGKAGNRESAKAMLGAWVDERSSEVFRVPLFNSLAHGVDGRSFELTAGSEEEKMPTGFLVTVVLVSASVAFSLAACCVCCYWRLKKTAEDSSFDSDYVESAY